MTEVVTSSAAFQQLNLLAPRQQVFVVERQGVDAGFATADIAPTTIDQSADNFAQHQSSADDQNPVNRHDTQPSPRPEPSPAGVSGPSKARIEIKHIDLGLTPSEVVGTPDILQRFDNNGDGRVDLGEAARAGLAREGVFTYAGLAAGQADIAPASAEPSPVAKLAVPAVVADAEDATLFTPADLPGAGSVQAKKIFVAAQAVAAQGTPTGVADAPKKFYGSGAEVVVGKFAVAETTPKFADKVVVKEQTVLTEAGTGEVKVHDKVAQTDTDQSSGNGTTYEKAKQLAAEGPAKKLVLVEVAAYADAAVISVPVDAPATAVTA